MRERIKLLHEALGTSGREFSASVGQSPSWSRTIGKTIGVDILANILTAYPQVNYKWVIYGEGSMFNTESDIEENEEKQSPSEPINADYRLICNELRYDNKNLRDENKNLRDLLLKEMQKNQELFIENTQYKVKEAASEK